MTGASSKGRGALEVIVFEEARFRGSLMFTSAEVTMGSDPGVMVRLDDPEVSACHAGLRFDGETCTVENYDGVSGTLVNGIPIERHELSPTDEIQIGRFRLRITLHRVDATPTPVSVRPPARPVPPQPRPAASAAPGRLAPSPVPATRPVPTPPPPSAGRSAPPPLPGARTSPALPAPAATPKKPVLAAPPPPPPPPLIPKAPPTPPPPAAPAPRQPSRSPTADLPRGRQLTNVAPAALAVAPPPPTPPTRPEPPPPREKPALAAVPTAPTAPSAPTRTSTQPLVSRPSAGHASPVAQGEMREATTRRQVPVPKSSPLLHLFDDDDDDDDAFFEPSFSLFDRLRDSSALVDKHSTVEVVRFRHGCILKLRHLRRGEKLHVHGMRKPLGRALAAGQFVFHRDAVPDTAAVSVNGLAVDDAAWRARADKRGHIALDPATQVLFPLPSGEGILVHLVPTAAPLHGSTWRPRLTKLMVALAAVSVVVHIVVFAILGLASLVRRDYIVENKEGRFARIALKEVELEPAAPPPKKEKEKKKPKPEPSQTASNEAPIRVASLHLPRHRTPSPPQAESTATAQKLLSALGSMSNASKPLSATAMSNLDAASPVRGGGFKVSGAIGRLPGDSLRLASAGSGIGRLDTKSTHDVGKDLGRVLGRGPTGQVRAQVTAKPNMMKVEGHLDRGEIQKVINAHIHELQGCYERQLVVNPNLSGKVTFEWVIGTSGGVTVVKIKSSTLSSNEATSCMQAAVRRWQFPSPSGGQVTVVYPIALANSGT